MRLIVDTNFIVRVARRNDDPAEANIARELLEAATVVAVPTLTLCEFDWVMRKHYKRPRAEVLASMRAIVAGPNVVVERDAVAVGFAFFEAGGDFADGIIAYDGRRLGGDVFASFDRKANLLARKQGFDILPAPKSPFAG